MKRSYGWILLALVLCVLSGIPVVVNAQDTMHEVRVVTPDFHVGDTITTDFDITCEGAVLKEITQWYQDGYPVDGGQFGRFNYTLRVKFTHPQGKAFDPELLSYSVNDYENGCSYFLEDDGKTLVLNIYFLFENVVRIYTPTFQVRGDITTDLDITCSGANLQEITAWYDEDWNVADGGRFRDNYGYTLRVRLTDPEGRPVDTEWLQVVVNDGEYSCSWMIEDAGYTLVVDIYVDFGTRCADQGRMVNMPTSIAPGPVTDLSDVYMYGYTYLESACWVDENKQPVSRFEAGKVYFLEAHIAPNPGYEFWDWFFLQSDAGLPYESWIMNEQEVVAWFPYTPAQTNISRVWIDYMPTSVNINDWLQDAVYVPEGASYTATVAWVRLPEQALVTEADQNGSYVMVVAVNAAEGCTFAENVTVTVDGQVFQSVVPNGNQLLLVKAYNVGLQSVNWIDATVETPTLGATPQLPTSNGSRCTVSQSVWLCNRTDDLMSAQVCESFQAGNYHYLLLTSQAADGYAFADDTDVYLNGRKAQPLLDINLGNQRYTVISFGKMVDPNQIETGDLNKDGAVDEDDAIYLLRHVLLGDSYPVDQDADYDKNGIVDEDDAIYLLRHVANPVNYPL